MGVFVGLDGFRGGWVAVWIDDLGTRGFGYAENLERLLRYPHALAMIDVPIGLPCSGNRACDVHARELLGPVVFCGVRRNLWRFDNYAQANDHYWAKQEPGISRQLWCIRWKIKEADDAITPEHQGKLRETHPELVFWRLNGRNRLHSKHSECGRIQRLTILREQGFTQIDRWLKQRHGTGIAYDDLVDACACACAARRAKHKIPEGEPQYDAKGLRMEMWY
jgi:predicted RNase H-like nuclease